MKIVLLRGCVRAGKSTVLQLLAGYEEGIATLELDAYKKAKYGSPAICNPAIDFPAIGKELKKLLRNHRAVVVEESFVDKAHVAAVARWAGFDLDSPRCSASGSISHWRRRSNARRERSFRSR